MAKRKSSTKREQQSDTMSLSPLERAALDADNLCVDLSNIAHVAAFLSDLHYDDGTGIAISGETRETLRGILYEWIRDTAGGDLSNRAEGVVRFLSEQSNEPKAVA